LLLVAQPVKQGASHLLGLQAHFGAFAGGHDPLVQGFQSLNITVLPSGYGLGDDCHVATRLGQVQLVHHPGRAAVGIVNPAVLDSGFESFRV